MLSSLLQGRLEQQPANGPARNDDDQSSQVLEQLSNRGISPEAILSMTNHSQLIGHRQTAPQPQIIPRQGHHEAASTSSNNSELLAIMQLLSNRGISPEALFSANALQQSPRLVDDAASQPQLPRQGHYETPPISNSSSQLLMSMLTGQQVQTRPSEGTGTDGEGNSTNSLQQLIALLLGHPRSQDLRLLGQSNRALTEETLAHFPAAILRNSDSNLTHQSREPANLRGQANQGDFLALLGAHGSQPAAAGQYRGGLLGGNQGGFRGSQETIANVLRSELLTRLAGQQQLQSSLPQRSPPNQSATGLSQLLSQRLCGLLGATSSSSSSSQTSDIASLVERRLQAQNTAHLFQRGEQMQRQGIEGKHEEDDRKPPAKKPRTQR